MKSPIFTCHTNGHGFWSGKEKSVQITDISLFYVSDDQCFGELRAKFNDSWDNEKDGLIYTDPDWIKTFRRGMKRIFSLSDEAINDINYSEQGMQGLNYVSMDVGKDFLKEWL